jgi:hypothetical protein
MTVHRDFVTADMRGLKAGLEARAAADRISVSAVLRRAVERELGAESEEGMAAISGSRLHRVNLRLDTEELLTLDAYARREGRSRSGAVSRLLEGAPMPEPGAPRAAELLAQMVTSNAEVASLAKAMQRLTALIAHGDVAGARPYRRLLDGLHHDVHAHLRVAARTLAYLRPGRPRHLSEADSPKVRP